VQLSRHNPESFNSHGCLLLSAYQLAHTGNGYAPHGTAWQQYQPTEYYCLYCH
jgi:hypothetical protein